MSTEVKLCKDCRWFVPPESRSRAAICGRTQRPDAEWGNLKRVGGWDIEVQRMFRASDACGPEGKFWEEKA